MKKRTKRIVSHVALLLIATSGISAFVFFAKRGEAVGNWIPAFLFFVIFAFLSIVGLVDCCTEK